MLLLFILLVLFSGVCDIFSPQQEKKKKCVKCARSALLSANSRMNKRSLAVLWPLVLKEECLLSRRQSVAEWQRCPVEDLFSLTLFN